MKHSGPSSEKNQDGTEFHVPHGSIVVHIHILDEIMCIEADFLNLPERARRHAPPNTADLNINKLLLAGFVKEGDRLKMRYVDTAPTKSSP